MKIESIKFHAYKGFAPGTGEDSAAQNFEIAPLTLIFGKNNSGKSAIARLPRLILGAMECSDVRIMPVEVRGLRYGAAFIDLVHETAFYNRPFFSLRANSNGEDLAFNCSLYIESALRPDSNPRVWDYEMQLPYKYEVIPPISGEGAYRPVFKGLLPPKGDFDVWRRRATEILDRMIHLGPIRESINATYSNEAFSEFGWRGEGAPYLLRQDGTLADEVSAWYEENMSGWRLAVLRESESFSLRLNRSGRVQVNLAQGGEGLQQALPVVAHQLWRKRAASHFFDVVEQPELHLHAAAQAPLADLFVNNAKAGHGQTVVETNSEAILLRVQRRVAEGNISPDSVAIYFVYDDDGRSKLRRIDIDACGELSWWPRGVFDENFREVAAIRRAQKKRNEARK